MVQESDYNKLTNETKAPYKVQGPNISQPRYWTTQCDCTANNGVLPQITESNYDCNSSRLLVGRLGMCIPASAGSHNFNYYIYDICGRTSPLRHGRYAIRGDLDSTCNEMPCGISGNSVGEDNLACYKYPPLPNGDYDKVPVCRQTNYSLQCTEGLTGSPPLSGCPTSAMHDCVYTANYGTSTTEYCPSERRQGDACSYLASGKCDGANTCKFQSSPCPENICSGASSICDGTNNGVNCDYVINSVCGVVTGQCTPHLEAIPVRILADAYCPTREAWCCSGADCEPLIPPSPQPSSMPSPFPTPTVPSSPAGTPSPVTSPTPSSSPLACDPIGTSEPAFCMKGCVGNGYINTCRNYSPLVLNCCNGHQCSFDCSPAESFYKDPLDKKLYTIEFLSKAKAACSPQTDPKIHCRGSCVCL